MMMMMTRTTNLMTVKTGLIICNWLLVAFTLILFPLMFDSLGRREFDLSPDVFADPKLAKCWKRRWRFLCLYWWTKDKDVRATFRDMGCNEETSKCIHDFDSSYESVLMLDACYRLYGRSIRGFGFSFI